VSPIRPSRVSVSLLRYSLALQVLQVLHLGAHTRGNIYRQTLYMYMCMYSWLYCDTRALQKCSNPLQVLQIEQSALHKCSNLLKSLAET
jgi:hypothetical protein